MSAALKENGPATASTVPSRGSNLPHKGKSNMRSNTIPCAVAPAIDYHGELMDALSVMQCVYLILDRGERLHVDTCMDLMVLINSAQEKIRPVADMLADGGNHA